MPRPFLKTRAKETRSTARPRQVQGQVDVPFMLLTVLLVVIGLIMLLSASYPSAYYDLKGNTGGDPFYYFKRQAGYALLGFGTCGIETDKTDRVIDTKPLDLNKNQK